MTKTWQRQIDDKNDDKDNVRSLWMMRDEIQMRLAVLITIVVSIPACHLGDWGSLEGRQQALWGFPGGSDGKESTCNAGDLGSIPGWEDPLEEGMVPNSSILA